MTTVAVVGLGGMGRRIALRLLSVGYDVLVWNRSPEKLAPLLTDGASAAATPREAASRSQTLITMLADPPALHAVTDGPNGLAAGAHPNLTIIEMSTVGPCAVRELASRLQPGVRLVDAPVLGSIGEAAAGTLAILAGGPADVVDAVRPMLAHLGALVHVGSLGAGAAAKLVANAALFGTLTALAETLALSEGLGLSIEASAAVLAATPLAEQARRRLPMIEAGDYPRRFALSLARKDADLIRHSAEAAGVEVPALDAARTWLAAAERAGRGGDDYTALLATVIESATRPEREWLTTTGTETHS